MGVSLKHALTTLFIILSLTTNMPSCLASTPMHSRRHSHNNKFIKKSCSITMYPRFCYASLSRYAMRNKIGTSHKGLAIAALSVTFSATRSTLVIMKNLTKTHGLKPRESAALHDCVEQIGDSVYELRKSMKELKVSGGSSFELQMNDIQTWVSAALTDDDTCMDGFEEVNRSGRVKVFVRRLVLNIAHLTSNALAFINLYADT